MEIRCAVTIVGDDEDMEKILSFSIKNSECKCLELYVEKEKVVHSKTINAPGTIHNQDYFRSLLTQSENTPSLSPRSRHGWSSPMIDHDL